MEYLCRFTVLSASALPKTERLSKIDPYILLLVNGQRFKTRAMDDNEEPVWDESFFPVVQAKEGGFLTGMLEAQLFDENVISDKMVGSVCVVLDGKTPADLALMTLPVQFSDPKFAEQGRASTITLAFGGAVQSYNSMRRMWEATPGFIANPQAQALYFPVPDPSGALYMGIEYEQEKGWLDVKVFVTQPAGPSLRLYADMMLKAHNDTNKFTKVERKVHPSGKVVAPGLKVYEELKLDDVPLGMDFNYASVLAFDTQTLAVTNTDKVVTAHGWAGAMSFQSAARKLHGVELDYENEEIYMTVDPQETVLVVDYDRDDADIKLGVVASDLTNGKGYDLYIKGQGSSYAKRSQVFFPPKLKLRGRLPLHRLVELDDLPYGTAFADIEIHKFQLLSPRQYTVQALTRIMG